MDDSIAPILPPELERPIFEIAALSRPKAIPDLMRVAWRVKHWWGFSVEPLLYRTLVVKASPETTDLFPSCTAETFMQIACTQKVSFLRDSVRNLRVYSLVPEHARTVLSTCTNVKNLHICVRGGPAQHAFPAFDTMPLRHLYCDGLAEFCDVTAFEPFLHPSFHQITHLELDSFAGSLNGLLELPRLTHLALSRTRPINACPQILATLTSLRVLVILCPPAARHHHVLAILAEDPRFVMMMPHAHDWQVGILTGIDYCLRAEQFIAKRMSGEIDREWSAIIAIFTQNNAVSSRARVLLGGWLRASLILRSH
ncbi:hypothetical protein C8R44DRAFT_882459 [Mycena epipterygia]|nr:hypothetical protein C8R44DRAFT_882459 [Mycena epipterygia]